MIRILVVANKLKWSSLDDKLEILQSWFKPEVDLEFDVVNTDFESVPFSPYTSIDPTQAGMNLRGVEPVWFDANVSVLGKGYDIVMLVLERDQWAEPNRARGWRADSTYGCIELQIGCNENEKLTWPNFSRMSAFFQLARHEIMHALFMIAKQNDTTHYWWNLGKIENALAELDFLRSQKLSLLTQLSILYKKLFTLMNKGMEILNAAKAKMGVDASPLDRAPDELGCAESVSTILSGILDFPIVTGTWTLWRELESNKAFSKVIVPAPGCVIISPTGTGKGSIKNGHAGIVGENGIVYSNNSASGKWDDYLTLDSWKDYYVKKGGYPVYYYQLI
jgi:hypothetical protein